MNATGGAGIQQSALISTFDIDKPEVRNMLLGPYGDQGMSEFHMMEDLGYVRGVAQDFTTQYEEDFISQLIHIGSGGITSLGSNRYSFVLGTVSPSNDFLASSTTSPYSTAYYVTPVRVNDRLGFQTSSGLVLMQVKTISGSYPTVTVTMEQSDTSLSFTSSNYPAGTEVPIIDNVYSEGSDQPTGIVNKPYIDHAYLQILKENFTTTGTQMTNQAWFQVAEFGGNLKGYFIKGQLDAEYRAKKQAFLAMMFGQVTTAMIDTTTNEPFKSTEGHLQYTQRRGLTLPYVAGTWSPLSLDAINKYLDSIWAPKSYMYARGIDLASEQDNALKSYFQFTNIDYVTEQMRSEVFGGDEGKAAAVNFTYLKKGDRTFAFKKIQSWSDRTTLGAAGFKTPGLGWLAPLGRTKDKMSGESRSFFGMLYKEMAGYSRRAEIWTQSGAGGNRADYILSQDINKLQIRQHIGAEHYGGQLFILTPQA